MSLSDPSLKGNGYELCLFVDYSPFRKGDFRRKDEFYHHSDIHLAKGPQEILKFIHYHCGNSMKAIDFVKGIDEPDMRKILSEHSVYEGSERHSILEKDMEVILYLAHVNKIGGVKNNGLYASSRKFHFSPERDSESPEQKDEIGKQISGFY